MEFDRPGERSQENVKPWQEVCNSWVQTIFYQKSFSNGSTGSAQGFFPLQIGIISNSGTVRTCLLLNNKVKSQLKYKRLDTSKEWVIFIRLYIIKTTTIQNGIPADKPTFVSQPKSQSIKVNNDS